MVDYITYYNGEVKGSQFDILYGQYAEERKKEVHTDQSFHISIRVRKGIMPQYPLRLLVKSDILLTESEEAYANRSWTLVDFVLYNKTTKHPILAIEVDGMAFHQVGSEQAKRDELKNSILDKAGIPLLRLTTDGSNEKNKIINALSR